MSRTVLVVEDDPDILDSVEGLLQQEGYAVLRAANGRQALDLLARGGRPGLILLDLLMPVMDGFELLGHLRGSAHAAIPVVVLSASSTLALPEDLPVVAKPLSLETLLEHVRRHHRDP